jgi:hypothetical protein
MVESASGKKYLHDAVASNEILNNTQYSRVDVE